MNPELIKIRGKPKKHVTLILLIQDNKVLLGKKKHKFAFGKRNGPGGKQDPGETLEECALRELKSESGLSASALDLIKVSEIDFYFSDNPDFDQTVHTYIIRKYLGEPKEVSDEIGDWQWYSFNELPLDEMWSADRKWLPEILKGKKLKAQFIYFKDEKVGENIVSYSKLEEVQNF